MTGRTPFKCAAWVLVVAAATCAPRDGRAEDAHARAARVFAEGEKAFVAREYARAATLFEDANAAEPHPATLWNAARSRHLAGELAGAANLYARFLRATPAPDDRAEAKAALATLQRYVARLTLRGVADGARVTIDGAPIDPRSSVYVDPGEHAVDASSDSGKAIHTSVRVAAGETAVVELAEPAPRPLPLAAPAPSEPPAREHHGLPPVFAAVAGGATMVVAGIALWSGLDVLAQRRQWDTSGSNADLDAGLAKQTRTNALIGVGVGLGVITGVVAVFTDWRAPFFGGASSSHTVGVRF